MNRFEDYTQFRAISADFDRRKLRYSNTAVDFQCLTHGIWGRNADAQRISPRACVSGLRTIARERAHGRTRPPPVGDQGCHPYDCPLGKF